MVGVTGVSMNARNVRYGSEADQQWHRQDSPHLEVKRKKSHTANIGESKSRNLLAASNTLPASPPGSTPPSPFVQHVQNSGPDSPGVVRQLLVQIAVVDQHVYLPRREFADHTLGARAQPDWRVRKHGPS